MLTPKFKVKTVNGKVIFADRKMFDKYIQRFEGKQFEITAVLPKNTRSLNQNRYYFGVVIEILADNLGYDTDEKELLHQFLSNKFLGFNKTLYGEEIRITPSTTSLKTDQFEDYLSKVRMWASKELSIYIPDPLSISY